jgi:hypothetical protein
MNVAKFQASKGFPSPHSNRAVVCSSQHAVHQTSFRGFRRHGLRRMRASVHDGELCGMSVADLRTQLNAALKVEDYKTAADLRDSIQWVLSRCSGLKLANSILQASTNANRNWIGGFPLPCFLSGTAVPEYFLQTEDWNYATTWHQLTSKFPA